MNRLQPRIPMLQFWEYGNTFHSEGGPRLTGRIPPPPFEKFNVQLPFLSLQPHLICGIIFVVFREERQDNAPNKEADKSNCKKGFPLA